MEILEIPEILEPFREDLMSTLRPSNRIFFTLEETKPWESKLGGCPYLTDIEEYPRGEDGNPMMFLAQINLGEMPSLPGFPEKGLLQFYVAADDDYGLDKDSLVKYIPEYITDEAALVQENPYCSGYEEYLPFTDNCKMTFEQEQMLVGADLPEFMALFGDVGGDESDELFDLCDASDSRLGGYPLFVQGAPDYYGDGSEYVLLLQLDIDDTSGLMFGDSGACTFLISHEDLRKRDFSAVEYDWQCC